MGKTKDTNQTIKLLLDKNEAAALLGCSFRHIQNLTARRLLPCVRLGKLVRYRRADLERALDKLTVRSI
ncbi:MAG: helix-turn-helix domain-containing protein [Chthoniobacterales bacterium]|nr:helix-turn-helix domain-containing protein [Chthoniobacterales bacterium]